MSDQRARRREEEIIALEAVAAALTNLAIVSPEFHAALVKGFQRVPQEHAAQRLKAAKSRRGKSG